MLLKFYSRIVFVSLFVREDLRRYFLLNKWWKISIVYGSLKVYIFSYLVETFEIVGDHLLNYSNLRL